MVNGGKISIICQSQQKCIKLLAFLHCIKIYIIYNVSEHFFDPINNPRMGHKCRKVGGKRELNCQKYPNIIVIYQITRLITVN